MTFLFPQIIKMLPITSADGAQICAICSGFVGVERLVGQILEQARFSSSSLPHKH
jgi:hypothetical protein